MRRKENKREAKPLDFPNIFSTSSVSFPLPTPQCIFGLKPFIEPIVTSFHLLLFVENIFLLVEWLKQ
jgi:hypothetical protein